MCRRIIDAVKQRHPEGSQEHYAAHHIGSALEDVIIQAKHIGDFTKYEGENDWQVIGYGGGMIVREFGQWAVQNDGDMMMW